MATLIAVPVFGKHGLEQWVRRFFLANGAIIPLFCITYFSPGYSVGQLLFGLPWGITVLGSLLVLALFFRRRVREFGAVASRQSAVNTVCRT